MKKGKKIIVFLIAMILSIMNIGVVKADTKNIEVTNIAVKDKSGTITVVDPVLSSNEITSNITFNKVDDFVTFELKIKNNELEKYKIESITDNNTNKNITIEYSFNEDYIKANETSTVTIKLAYKNKLKNVEKINLNNLVITLNLVNEQGEGTSVVVNNPTTGDNILMYLLFLILALSGIIFIIKRTRVKRLKIGTLVVLVSILILPFAILALEKYEVKIKFTDIEIKGEFETYNITIDPKNGETPVTKAITYGDSIGELSESPSKEGYTFDKWVDSDGNTVTKDTVITGPIEIEAKYKVKEYTITYNLDGGTVTGNPEKYTIESNDITLKNPRKTGYTFTGWTGTGIDEKTTSVTIENGSTGNRSYTANYSANEDTEYTVTHRYQKLDGTYEEEVVTEYGETDKEVNAPIQSRTGFENPRVQQVTINADGSSSVTYTYTRTNYNFSITDRTYIDSTSTSNGEYPYETEITVKATEREGYTFKWSDNDTNYERTFKLKDNKELTPIYTANTNTRYVVKHYKMNLDGTTYSLADTQNLTGTTDSEVTPSVNDYEGFTSPSTQTVTIKGDGTTEVEYQYTRNKYTLTLEDSEYIETTATTGEYYYGETITLKAKDKDGYTFEKWSNDSPNEEIELTITGNITIKPIYTANTYTVIFNSNGGGEVSSITVDAGESIQSFTTPTSPTNKIFDGWWTELNEGTKVNTPYTPEGNITLYAHWNNNSFPEVFSEPGECTFNGSSGVLTGDNCSYANGTNKYIDTGINLYNNENHDKDYEIGFTIVSTNLSEQVSQATFMNTKLEGNNYPGLVFRKRNNNTEFDLSSRKSSSANEVKYMSDSGVETVKIYRITNTDTGVQEIFYSINDEEKVKLNDLSSFNPEFDLSVWFGAAPTNASATAAQRILVNTTLKDMYIKLGTYQESSNTETYKVTYNANGGSVSPTSKKIKEGSIIGTLPEPTKGGYTFIGWYTGLTDGVEVTENYTINKDTEIFARYTKNPTYTISFDAGDGSSVDDIEIEQGSAIGELPTTTYAGYRFDGWFVENTYVTEVTSETIPTGNTTYYAKWTEVWDKYYSPNATSGTTTFSSSWNVWIREKATEKQLCAKYSNDSVCFSPDEIERDESGNVLPESSKTKEFIKKFEDIGGYCNYTESTNTLSCSKRISGYYTPYCTISKSGEPWCSLSTRYGSGRCSISLNGTPSCNYDDYFD